MTTAEMAPPEAGSGPVPESVNPEIDSRKDLVEKMWGKDGLKPHQTFP